MTFASKTFTPIEFALFASTPIAFEPTAFAHLHLWNLHLTKLRLLDVNAFSANALCTSAKTHKVTSTASKTTILFANRP